MVFNQNLPCYNLSLLCPVIFTMATRNRLFLAVLSAATIYVFEGCYYMSPPGSSPLDQKILILFHLVFSFQSSGL